MTHDLINGDVHLQRIDTFEWCNCFGPCCAGPEGSCICEDCDCVSYAELKEARAYEAAIKAPLPDYVVEEINTRIEAGTMPTRKISPHKSAHVCEDCGTEVFRNGTRGRFPKKCPECKAK